MPQFKKYKLKELVAKANTGLDAIKRAPIVSHDTGVKCLRIQDVSQSKDFKEWGFTEVSKENYERFALKKDEIILARTGNTIGVNVFIDKDLKSVFNNGLIRLRTNKQKCDPQYLYYNMQTTSYWSHIDSIAFGTSTQPNMQIQSFLDYEIEMPDPPTQSRIASILSSLDDKIELNRRTNQTLEQIAQTLFKNYFLDDIDPENLQEGWRWGRLDEIISVKHGYAFEGKYFTEDATENILLTPGNFKIGGGFNYNKFKYYSGKIPNDYILQKNDLIVTMTDLSKDGDTLGYSALTPVIYGKKILHNQRIGKVLFKETDKLKYFLYWLMRSEDYRSFVLGSATGTTVKHTSPTRICEYACAIPTEIKLIEFNKIIEKLVEKELINQNEIETLSTLRDSLLPKLMSGEIEVNATEKELVN